MATDIFKHRPPWAPVLDGLESIGRLNVNVVRHLKEGDLRGAVEALKDDWQTATGLALVTFALVVAACAPAIDRVIHPTQISLPEPFPASLKLEASNETKLLQRFADRFSPDSPNHGPLVLNSESVAAADAIELTTPDKTTTIVVAPAVDAGSVRVADTTYWREEPDGSFQRVSQKIDSTGYLIYLAADGETLLRMHQVPVAEADQLTDEQLMQKLGLQIMGGDGQWYNAQVSPEQYHQLFPGSRKVNAAPAQLPTNTPTPEPSPTFTVTPMPEPIDALTLTLTPADEFTPTPNDLILQEEQIASEIDKVVLVGNDLLWNGEPAPLGVLSENITTNREGQLFVMVSGVPVEIYEQQFNLGDKFISGKLKVYFGRDSDNKPIFGEFFLGVDDGKISVVGMKGRTTGREPNPLPPYSHSYYPDDTNSLVSRLKLGTKQYAFTLWKQIDPESIDSNNRWKGFYQRISESGLLEYNSTLIDKLRGMDVPQIPTDEAGWILEVFITPDHPK